MPLPLPNLDDHTFADLVAEGRSLIPRHAPEWTNHNPSDPGITLMELFAWLTEMILYRVNQVPEENYTTFLDLIGVTKRKDETVEDAIARAIRCLTARTRAVSLDDFEYLATRAASPAFTEGIEAISQGERIRLEDFEFLALGTPGRARAKALVGTLKEGEKLWPGRVYVVLLPDSWSDRKDGNQIEDVLQTVEANLQTLCPVTTTVKVVKPDFKEVVVDVVVAPREGVKRQELENSVRETLERFTDPYQGGNDGSGWPFGGALYRSHLYRLIEKLAGVDHVERLAMNGQWGNESVPLARHQLLELTEVKVSVLE